MWTLAEVRTSAQLWFSDGKPIESIRGGDGLSSRLMVDQLGFLDIVEITSPAIASLNVNGSWLWTRVRPKRRPSSPHLSGPKTSPLLRLSLEVSTNATFRLTVIQELGEKEENNENGVLGKFLRSICIVVPSRGKAFRTSTFTASGTLKPLPKILSGDISLLEEMITGGYVPYQNIPESPGKSVEDIKSLGRILFPFTAASFSLAISVYDWTTASFARMVFFKIFQYTGLRQHPSPLDMTSIAHCIWASDWGPYTPRDPDFMNSFMMDPASSLHDVETQLRILAPTIYKFSEAQNRLLAAAMQAMPRTSVYSKPQLYSGQIDISQLTLDHFGIEFAECPANNGPMNKPLKYDFERAMATYISTGKIITTKMVWSFTDALESAMHYSNGILLVANPPVDAPVWETATYITPLSDDPKKTEYTFPLGSRFEVQSVKRIRIVNKEVIIIVLQPKTARVAFNGGGQPPGEIRCWIQNQLSVDDIAHRLQAFYSSRIDADVSSEHKRGGRWCACKV